MHHKEKIIRTLDLILDDVRSPQIFVDVVDLFVLGEPPSVQSAHVRYQVTFVEPP